MSDTPLTSNQIAERMSSANAFESAATANLWLAQGIREIERLQVRVADLEHQISRMVDVHLARASAEPPASSSKDVLYYDCHGHALYPHEWKNPRDLAYFVSVQEYERIGELLDRHTSVAFEDAQDRAVHEPTKTPKDGECAEAWHKVWNKMRENNPDFYRQARTGEQCALLELDRLYGPAQPPRLVPADASDIEALSDAYIDTADARRYQWLRQTGVRVLDDVLAGPELDAAVDAERTSVTKSACEHGLEPSDCLSCRLPSAKDIQATRGAVETGDGR